MNAADPMRSPWMHAWAAWPVRASDAVLRGHAWPRSRWALLALVLGFGGMYGLVLGSYGGVSPERWWQMGYSAAKVPMLLLLTFGLGLPSFFVVHGLLGLSRDFPEAVAALLKTQAAVTVVLASLGPVTAVWYLGAADRDAGYASAKLFNALMFGVASVAGQVVLRRAYRPLIARDARHRWLLGLWLGIYAFVGVQMAWLLRPFIGDPSLPTRFFRPDAWGNAYEALWSALMAALGVFSG
ncbi:MAG: hypothetical protein AAF086_05940 [Planctomycetota bacterium]